MVDRLFADASLAALYDAMCAERDDFDFYLPLVMSARSVLDVGCGTGELLHRARQQGHRGRLCGLDPAQAMLDQARVRTDVDWVLGELPGQGWTDEFDLVVMTGHAFQVLLDDEELAAFLTAARTALAPHGRFVFETRNPSARAWEQWTSDVVHEVQDAEGRSIRHWHQVEEPLTGDRVSFRHTLTAAHWPTPQHSHSTLRFLEVPELRSFLDAAGLAVEEQYGEFDRAPVTAGSREIVTVARRA